MFLDAPLGARLLNHRQIAAAAQVGMLAREPDPVSAGQRALRLLTAALAADAATLVALDPVTGAHVPIAELGYAPEENRIVSAVFVGTPWHRRVLQAQLPPSISDDQSFRRTWFYQRYVAPAGFRDGMTGALRHRGRYVGVVHLSAQRRDAFDTQARHLLGGFLPALAGLADLTGRACQIADLPPDRSASLVTAERDLPLPDREPPPMLAEPSFRRLVAEFAESAGAHLRTYWAVARQWHAVTLTRQPPLPGTPAAWAVLVHARPASLPYRLSPRELDVLTRIALGRSNPAIAKELFLSPRTIHSHVEHIMRKTSTSTRTEAAALAIREDLVHAVPGLPLRILTSPGGAG